MNFEKAVQIILRHEGGYSNDPNDPGGETKYGISKRAYPEENIAKLTLDQAKEIYQRDYWEKNNIDDLPEEMKLIYFDCCVNQGPGRAKQLYNMAKFLAEKDDKIGVVSEFAKARAQHYAALKTWSIYGIGWMKRLIDVSIRTLE